MKKGIKLGYEIETGKQFALNIRKSVLHKLIFNKERKDDFSNAVIRRACLDEPLTIEQRDFLDG